MKITSTPRTITIELSEEQAEHLLLVSNCIAGDFGKSPRKTFQELSGKLESIGIVSRDFPLVGNDTQIMFDDLTD